MSVEQGQHHEIYEDVDELTRSLGRLQFGLERSQVADCDLACCVLLCNVHINHDNEQVGIVSIASACIAHAVELPPTAGGIGGHKLH